MNIEKLSEKYGLSPSSIFQMLSIFVNTTAFEISEIEKALENKDFNKIKELSHKVKTSFLYFDLADIANVFQDLETCALSKESVEKKIAEAKTKTADILKSFKEMIDQHNKPEAS